MCERAEWIAECDATARVFTHRASGGRLLALSCEDPKKLFGITFRTPIQNGSGVAHVLEHLVLRGSQRFSHTSVFAETARSGHAYSTAITSEDRTTFVVGASDPEDLRHLIAVQLDAVLHPRSLSAAALREEVGGAGDRRDASTGVAYNEALAAWGSSEQVLEREVRRALFPDAIWSANATGDPRRMRRLSVGDVLRTHSRYYRASNGYLFLYGNGDLEHDLRLLDAHLPRCREVTVAPSRMRLRPRAVRRGVEGRLLPAGRSAVVLWSVSYDLGPATTADDRIALLVLGQVLGRLVERTACDAGLAPGTNCAMSLGPRPHLSVVGTTPANDDAQRRFRAVTAMFEPLAHRAIPSALVAAAIDRVELALRDPEAPGATRGLTWHTLALDGWLYAGDPLAFLKFSGPLRRIRDRMRHGYLQRIIRTRILRNPRVASVEVTA